MNSKSPSRNYHIIGIAFASLALILYIFMAIYVTERIPHLEDEATYIFQARIFAHGRLWAPAPSPGLKPYHIPFTLAYSGKWMGKYAVGWPLLLAVGSLLKAEWLVNPIIGSATVYLTYLIAQTLYNRQTGIIAALLMATSPFFLIQSSTFMSHASSAFWVALLIWCWIRIEKSFDSPPTTTHLSSAVAGFSAGMLVLTRPLTALAVLLPFGIRLLVHIKRHSLHQLVRAYWAFVLVAVLVSALQPTYLYITTDSPTTNLYTLIWSYDRIGFGPGTGAYDGHTIRQAFITARQDIEHWSSDLLGLPYASWTLPLIGLIYSPKLTQHKNQNWGIILAGMFFALVLIYSTYWVGGSVYGPRYYYEAICGVIVLSAVGVIQIGTWLFNLTKKSARWLSYGILALVIALNTVFYLPQRLPDWHQLYGITREPLDTLNTLLDDDENILLFVRGDRWTHYAVLFSENSPFLDSPILAVHEQPPEINEAIISHYPERSVWYYVDGQFSREPFPAE